MSRQLATVTRQAARLHACLLRGIQLFDDVGEKQNFPRRAANGFGNVAIRLRLTFGPRRGVEVPAEQRGQFARLLASKN